MKRLSSAPQVRERAPKITQHNKFLTASNPLKGDKTDFLQNCAFRISPIPETRDSLYSEIRIHLSKAQL